LIEEYNVNNTFSIFSKLAERYRYVAGHRCKYSALF